MNHGVVPIAAAPLDTGPLNVPKCPSRNKSLDPPLSAGLEMKMWDVDQHTSRKVRAKMTETSTCSRHNITVGDDHINGRAGENLM